MGGNGCEHNYVNSVEDFSCFLFPVVVVTGAHTSSVIVNLAVGDEVSVVATGSETIFLSGDHTTLFSGYYI